MKQQRGKSFIVMVLTCLMLAGVATVGYSAPNLLPQYPEVKKPSSTRAVGVARLPELMNAHWNTNPRTSNSTSTIALTDTIRCDGLNYSINSTVLTLRNPDVTIERGRCTFSYADGSLQKATAVTSPLTNLPLAGASFPCTAISEGGGYRVSGRATIPGVTPPVVISFSGSALPTSALTLTVQFDPAVPVITIGGCNNPRHILTTIMSNPVLDPVVSAR